MLIQACQGEENFSQASGPYGDKASYIKAANPWIDAANLAQKNILASDVKTHPYNSKVSQPLPRRSRLDPDPARPTQTLNIILRRPHSVLLLSTVRGGLAYRGLFTGAIADQICMSDGETDIYTMFTRAAGMLTNQDQTPEVRGPLEKSLIFPPASSNLSVN